MTNVLFLIFIPLIFAFITLLANQKLQKYFVVLGVLLVVLASIDIYYHQILFSFVFSENIHSIIKILDVILLLFFLYRGFIEKNKLVSIFASIQIVIFSIILLLPTTNNSYDLVVDNIAMTMFLVINIVGGIIIIYSLEYIKTENFSNFKKNSFISLLFLFLGVMNLLVSANSLEIFFFCFELTTLFSYLLIRYRLDSTAKENALRALWMNQIGGVAILVSLLMTILLYDTIFIDKILNIGDDLFLLIVALLALAAFVKGASNPFQSWLLGAMVAPTPVSAILHSATMVKIAPYLILKISPAFSPFLSLSVTLFGAFVFMVASLMALNKDFFKEILGLSTIALLGLMISVASIHSHKAVEVCLILIVFHAISKALLFMQAGILEKQFHLKNLSDINHLISHSKLLVFFILVGFASLTLPPFGAFFGKFFSIELFISLINENVLYIFPLVCILFGTVFLTILYFKVATKLLTKRSDTYETTKILPLYKYTSFALVFLLICGLILNFDFESLGIFEVSLPIALILFFGLFWYFSRFIKANIIKEYNCGEKDEFENSAFYIELKPIILDAIKYISIGLLVIMIVGSLI